MERMHGQMRDVALWAKPYIPAPPSDSAPRPLPQLSDVPANMVVLGSTETGEGLDDDEMRKAGLGTLEVEMGRRNSTGLQAALGAAMGTGEPVWAEGHTVQPLVIHSASPDGKLSATPDKAWGAVTSSTGALAAGPVGPADWVCSICGRRGHKHGAGDAGGAVPMEAVLGMVAAAAAAAAEKLEREEVELMALADEAEKEMEQEVGGALPSMKSLSREKAKRVLKMLAGRCAAPPPFPLALS